MGSATEDSTTGTARLGADERLRSIDTLRGIAIVFMALDHTRTFWGLTQFSPEDPAQTSVAWFFTRWVTHFCAPVFVFLTGLSAYLYGAKGRTRKELSVYLLSRGLWLIVLELTIINASWRFAVGEIFFLTVIWAIGCSMILLAGLIWLPRNLILGLAVILIGGHNAFDGLQPESFGQFSWLWNFLHVSGYVPLSDSFGFVVAYPVIPWCGVMALGYFFGPIVLQPDPARARKLLIAGVGLIVLFIVLRTSNVYGDSERWTTQERGIVYTLLSFLKVTKYPPSLLFLCVTLGGGLILLVGLDKVTGRLVEFLATFGRVPLFFYLLHIPIARLTGVLKNQLFYDRSIDPFGPPIDWPPNYDPRIWLVYIAWTILLIVLYPACKWFGAAKQKHLRSLLRYL